MKAVTTLSAIGAAIAALSAAAPASAQYYPGNPYGYGMPGYGMPGYGYGAPDYGYGQYGYGANSQVVVNQCVAAVQARLNGGYGGYGYNPYGYGGGRVLGISRVQPDSAGGSRVHGVATSGRYAGYGTPNSPVDLVWNCRTDFRGAIVGIDLHAAQPNYGYQPTPYNDDYSQYGYVRY